MRVWLVVSVLVVACVPAFRATANPSASYDVSALRTKAGACADQWIGATTHIQACAVTGAPFTLVDSDAPFIVTHFDAGSFPEADPGNWLIIVTGPDGKEILRRSPQHSVPEVGECREYGCTKWNIATLELPAPWQPGVYRVRYVCSFDTRRSTDLTIALTGRAGSARNVTMLPSTGVAAKPLFSPPWAAKNIWAFADERAFLDRCQHDSAVHYGPARTAAQIEWGCECLAWGAEDHYTTAEAVRVMKEDLAAFQRTTAAVNAECKRTRPAELGPDPTP